MKQTAGRQIRVSIIKWMMITRREVDVFVKLLKMDSLELSIKKIKHEMRVFIPADIECAGLA
jgi:hypothetical protein